MIQSMTGYGRGEAKFGSLGVVAEIRATNHKYFDIVIRLPKFLAEREGDLKKKVQQRFTRGRFDLSVNVNGLPDHTRRLELDLTLADQYTRILKRLKTQLRLPGQVDLALLTGFREIISVSEKAEASQGLTRRVDTSVRTALRRLEEMRSKEGRSLVRDLQNRVRFIEGTLDRIQARSPEVVREYQARLQERVHHLTQGLKIDPGRLAQEVALCADRCDISEEITRLKSHLRQFRTMIREKVSIGRSLDFLIQEMNREVNTIGSKSNNAAIAMEVVSAKSELEKIREQVQNIE